MLYVGDDLLSLQKKVPSARSSLTSVFGMRTGVPSMLTHQHTKFIRILSVFILRFFNRKTFYIAYPFCFQAVKWCPINIWWTGWQDMNLRPPVLETGTLPTELHPNIKTILRPTNFNIPHFTHKNCHFRVQHSLWEIRLISTPRLHPLLDFHLVPINLIISQET